MRLVPGWLIACVVGLALVWLSVEAAFAAPSPAPKSPLRAVMEATGLKFSGLEDGTFVVLINGEQVPTVVLRIGAGGQGPVKTAWISGKITRVNDARDWPTPLFPWLLGQNLKLLRGAFGLSTDGRELYYVDNLPLSSLDAATLKTAIEFAALVVDKTYRDVKGFTDQR